MQIWIPSCQHWDGKGKRQSFLCFPPSYRVWILPLQLLRRNWGNGPGATEDPKGSHPKDLYAALKGSQNIPQSMPAHLWDQKDPRKLPKGSMCIPPKSQNISKIISIHPTENPRVFPQKICTSAAEGRAGPGFPPGSGRPLPSSAAGIHHPLQI